MFQNIEGFFKLNVIFRGRAMEKMEQCSFSGKVLLFIQIRTLAISGEGIRT